MKTAISVPDDVFNEVERLRKLSNRQRSEVYTDALREYVARHRREEVATSWRRVLAEIDQSEDSEFLEEAARDLAKRIEW
jgi:metal-responsive CopG/Arc/MetJ family transcriptional regulator